MLLTSCADASIPGTRHVNIPSPTTAQERRKAVNEKPDSVLYLPLGEDVLLPHTISGDPLPDDQVGPFELRAETLAGALQLILADYDIPLAFQTDDALTKTVTMANMHGPLNRIVSHVCGLADLYCSFEDGILVVKNTQTFTVSIPPVTSGDTDIIDAVATGLQAITGLAPVIDKGTRTIVYTATQRTAEMAERYFQRMRANTALIVFEVYIWEVALSAGNATGIDWDNIDRFGKFKAGISITGSAGATNATPISIGLPTTGPFTIGANDVLQFISEYGAVKTISQPQIAVLSGAKASLRVADTVNYVSSLERTIDNGEVSVSTETDSVDTGFTMSIGSAWDNATVYGSIEINLQEFRKFTEFDADGTTLKLPETTERELKTQIRIRPGDSLLIAGLVRENDEYNSNGPGFMEPFLPTSRDATTGNVELVFLLRPRVIVYTAKNTPMSPPHIEAKPSSPPSSPVPPLSSAQPLEKKTVAVKTTISDQQTVAAAAAQLNAVEPAAGMPSVRLDKVTTQPIASPEEPFADSPALIDPPPPAPEALPPLFPEPPKPAGLTYGVIKPDYTEKEHIGSTPLTPAVQKTSSSTPPDASLAPSTSQVAPASSGLLTPTTLSATLPSSPSPSAQKRKEDDFSGNPVEVSPLPFSAAAPPTPLAPPSIPPAPQSETPVENSAGYAPDWKTSYPDADSLNPYLRKLKEP